MPKKILTFSNTLIANSHPAHNKTTILNTASNYHSASLAQPVLFMLLIETYRQIAITRGVHDDR